MKAPALSVFNDLGRLATLFSFDGSFSPPAFYNKRKNEENLWTRSLNFFAKCIIDFSLFLALLLSMRRFSLPLEG